MTDTPIFIEKREQSDQIRTMETALLCGILTAGISFSIFSVIGAGREQHFMVLAFSETVVLILSIVNLLLSPQRNLGVFLAPAASLVTAFFIGPSRWLNGMKHFFNSYISGWNLRFEDGVRLFSVDGAGNWDGALFFLSVLFLISAVFWFLIRKRAFFMTETLVFLFCIPGFVLRIISPLGAVLTLSSMIGFWLFSYQAGSFLRRVLWFFSLTCAFFVIRGIAGNQTSVSILRVQTAAREAAEDLIYGTDTLPEGDLSNASGMEIGDEPRLSITTDQVKPLYFRSFTGAEYADNAWTPLKKSAYGGERYGFLKWLSQNGFDPAAQFASYIKAGNTVLAEDQAVEKNLVTVTNRGANRKYLYTLYSSESPSFSSVSGYRDNGYLEHGIFAKRKYSLSEYSSNLPGELQRLSGWVYEPENDSQEQYLNSESVYRSFVHENYTDIDDACYDLITSLFHESDERDVTGSLGVYEVTKRIRSILETNTRYEKEKTLLDQETPENEDLLTAFLLGDHAGNSAYYASAAVLAFRSFDIPARYAEGYFLSSRTIEAAGGRDVQLTSSDAHAWVEVYMDGMGWIPVDVTPGFYYDTYALLQMAQIPSDIQRTAALEDSGEEVDAPDSLHAGKRPDSTIIINWLKTAVNILWGILLVILFFKGIGIVILEFRHLITERRLLGILELPPGKRAGMMFQAIRHSLFFFEISIHPGWNCSETEARLSRILLDYEPGLYTRVNELMEKYYYGGEDLKEYELRLLYRFLTMIRSSRKNLTLLQRFRMRYDL